MTFRSPMHREVANDLSEGQLNPFSAAKTRVESPKKISFIIPVFNGLELTKACLESLTATVEDFEHEIIVVDDGSTDGTRAFLSSIERPDVHVVLNDENLGYARANNAGAVVNRF